jgi:hypothetical protein
MKKKGLIAATIAAAMGGWAIFSIPSLDVIDTRTHAPTARTIHLYKTGGAAAFGHPLVAGGIHNLEELRLHAGLYDGLNPENAIFTVLTHGTFAYVSYVKNGVLYWTRQPRYIKAGEPIIIAGNGMVILQKCGNIIRFDTPAPVETLFDQPDDLYPPDTVPGDIIEMPLPKVPMTTMLVPSAPIIPSAPITPPQMGQSSPITIPSFIGGFAPFGAPSVVSVDEPSTLAMSVIGLFILCVVARFRTWFKH